MGDLPLRTPTYHRLGGPLPRQLSNRTHGHPVPPKILHPKDASRMSYGTLIHVSMGYSPVQGRFHTRYSPVRRSPAEYCYSPLPLDLHVLSLSLAFILSQDQTLRCCILFLFSFQNQKKARRVYVVYTFADTHAAPIRNESSSPAVIESPGRTDRDISAAGTGPDGAFSCTTSSLIYCNSFNVLSFRFFLGNALQS